jgi:hypothetical protein
MIRITQPRKSIVFLGNYRAEVRTNRQMMHYIDFTEEFIGNHPDTQFVNLNTAGARIEGMTLDVPESLEKYLAGPVNAGGRIAKRYAAGLGDVDKRRALCRDALQTDLPLLQCLRKECMDAAMVCNQLLMLVRQPRLVANPEARLHELLGQLSAVDDRLRNDPVMHLLDARLETAHHALSERMTSEADLRMAPSVRSHRRWRAYYMEVAKACEETEQILRNVLEQFGQHHFSVRENKEEQIQEVLA